MKCMFKKLAKSINFELKIISSAFKIKFVTFSVMSTQVEDIDDDDDDTLSFEEAIDNLLKGV